MTSELIVFLVLSLVAISSAFGMLFSRNAVYSALFLVLNFVTVAVFYLMLGAPFIAMSQITVYAGAIMVLFLFVIMLLGAESLVPLPQAMPWQRPLAFILAAILAVESVYLIFARSRLNTVITAPDAATNSMEGLRDMAMILFDQFLLPFEITSILLLVAMVGAIVLTNREKVGHK
ncbi:MAG: NADH-quinone oxidoreductase subunit J [Anaerolineales bacterium]|jgi:NADH-quinone oxidoreductase subunit J|uniref:NADH-quinone oxidoreductase subunit J n=1 Tax=Candidatus Villigracilis proximus TaxID=3140683 RepID=UPI0031363F03|nr:NADH-quinone oxidoreductase subunit J [Anaerolineales bacterium]MBK8824611.1 NADH-quinone oxidoreductase subunit J [Anaerolineales bacterium]MBK9210244.1 NADH-quinone oxidoreductase subunit J [Anaerolineales bacterium]